MKKYIISLICILLCVCIAGIASANPGIVVSVTPDSQVTGLGGTVTYQVQVRSITTMTESVVLSVENQEAGWGYLIDDPEFLIGPGEIITRELNVTVPSSTSSGEHEAIVRGNAAVPGFEGFIIETGFSTFITDISVPEFPSILAPIFSIILIIFVIGRTK